MPHYDAVANISDEDLPGLHLFTCQPVLYYGIIKYIRKGGSVYDGRKTDGGFSHPIATAGDFSGIS